MSFYSDLGTCLATLCLIESITLDAPLRMSHGIHQKIPL